MGMPSAAPATPATKPPDAAVTQDQGTAPLAQTPPAPPQTPPQPAAPAKTSAGPPHPPTAKRPHRKKRVLTPCSNTPGAGQTTSGAASGAASSSADPPSEASSSPPATANPCPPSKVIVRQGGASEPSIQLAGGTADQASHQRDTANQMLGSTEANLKKVVGQQLSSNQQDMVNQIRQFMAQSKAAMDAGDLERARTLAWKAQLLSEELVKPDK
jgi:hypothetical protein